MVELEVTSPVGRAHGGGIYPRRPTNVTEARADHELRATAVTGFHHFRSFGLSRSHTFGDGWAPKLVLGVVNDLTHSKPLAGMRKPVTKCQFDYRIDIQRGYESSLQSGMGRAGKN